MNDPSKLKEALVDHLAQNYSLSLGEASSVAALMVAFDSVNHKDLDISRFYAVFSDEKDS